MWFAVGEDIDIGFRTSCWTAFERVGSPMINIYNPSYVGV
jgi:hypothetical protein